MDDLSERQLREEKISEVKKGENLDSKEMPNSLRSHDGYAPKHLENGFSHTKALLIDAEGLEKTLQGLTNMALAHEIALNKDFELRKPDRSKEPLSQEVQDALNLKEYYWQKVDDILMNKSIKECKHTIMDLILHLKTMLHSTMLPHNVKMREKVDLELDMEKISKQIDNDAFDFVHYMDFILDSLAALCCPIRDQEIVEIRGIEVPSRQVRKTIDLMENMNLDMANFIISQSRNHIVQNCVTYERNKFASYVDLQYRMGNDPVKVTRDWILRHVIPGRTFNETMANAYWEILEWKDEEGPETLTLDWNRFPPIRSEIQRVTIIGAMIAALFEYARSLVRECPEDSNDYDKSQDMFRKNLSLLTKLREELNLLITTEEVLDSKKLQEALERCCIQAVQVVAQYRTEECGEGLSTVEKDSIADRVRPLIDANHPVRQLYYRRVKEWVLDLAKEEGKGKPVPPQNLSLVGPIIVIPITEMLRLTYYGRNVFDILYQEIYDGNCPPPVFYPLPLAENAVSELTETNAPDMDKQMEGEIAMDDAILNVLAKLQGLADKSMVIRKPLVRPVTPADLTGAPLEILLGSIPEFAQKGSSKK